MEGKGVKQLLNPTVKLLTFRLQEPLKSDFKKALVTLDIGLQHVCESLAESIIASIADPKAKKQLQPILDRARELQQDRKRI